VQSARRITVDSITTYAASGTKVASVAQSGVDLDNLSSTLTGVGGATLSLLADPQVMKPILSQQVFLVLQYHFGMS